MHSFWARFRLRFPARSMAPSNKNHPRTTPRHAIVLHPHDIHRPGAQVSRQLWTRSKVGEPQTDITSSIESMTTSKHSFLKQPQSPPNPYWTANWSEQYRCGSRYGKSCHFIRGLFSRRQSIRSFRQWENWHEWPEIAFVQELSRSSLEFILYAYNYIYIYIYCIIHIIYIYIYATPPERSVLQTGLQMEAIWTPQKNRCFRLVCRWKPDGCHRLHFFADEAQLLWKIKH